MNLTLGQKLIRTKTAERQHDEASSGGGLQRSLGLFPLTMIGVGATVGTGIFFTMVEAVPKAGPAVILSFLLAAVTAGLTALCYAELAGRVPAAGSSYSFAYATVGEFAAFIVAACLLLEYGLAGSAVATMLSEALCCLFCLIYIKKKVPLLCLGRKWRVFDASILWRTFTYGITSALQQMCIQLGKICVQTIVNVQGVAFIAAYTAINRVDDFALTPQGNISHAATTFMAQNRGAGKISRMKRGFLDSILLQIIYSAAVSVAVFVLARPIMQFFVSDGSEEVITLGISYLKLIALMYLMPAATNVIQGFFRGMGDLKVTLISTILNFTARFLSAWLMIHVMGGAFSCLAWANFFGWIAMFAFELPMMVMRWKKMSATSIQR